MTDTTTSDFKRWLLRMFMGDRLDQCEIPPDPEPLPSKGAAAAATAEELWSLRIEEPPGHGWQMIDNFIRGVFGLMWGTADAVTWKLGAVYDEDGMFHWCGAFGAECHGRHGLKPEIRKKHLPSTYRLRQFCKGTAREIPIDEAQPGDIAVVSNGSKAHGEHITVVVGVRKDEGLYETIEGNAKGLGPDGRLYEGVVRRTRPFVHGLESSVCPISGLSQRMRVIFVYRFLEEDYA